MTEEFANAVPPFERVEEGERRQRHSPGRLRPDWQSAGRWPAPRPEGALTPDRQNRYLDNCSVCAVSQIFRICR
jgi:hypothetical protein